MGKCCLQHCENAFHDSSSVTSTSETPDAGFEPTTNGLTVHCSTAELIRNKAAILGEATI